MSYRAIFYLLCIIALIFGSGVSAEDLFPFDDFKGPFSTTFDFDESISMGIFLNASELDGELTEEELALLENIFANDITDEAKNQVVQDPS